MTMTALASFRARDGTEFKDRAEFRKYVFLTQYTFANRQGEILRKSAGEIDGQPFDLAGLQLCEVTLLDHSETVHADELTGCRVFIAACAESVFVRNCSGCKFTLACKQLRTRDCVDCEFRLYCKTEPIIETSSGMIFGPFNGAYVGHSDHLSAAGLTTPNLWFGVYDFNDEAKTRKNWRLLEPDDEGEPWRPLSDSSEVAVPRTTPGSVPLPSGQASKFGGVGTGCEEGSGTPTMAFSLSTSRAEAVAAVKEAVGDCNEPPGEDLLRAITRNSRDQFFAAKAAPTDTADTSLSRNVGSERVSDKPRIGWDPSRLAMGDPTRVAKVYALAEGEQLETAASSCADASNREALAAAHGTASLQGTADVVVAHDGQDQSLTEEPPKLGRVSRVGWDPARAALASSATTASITPDPHPVANTASAADMMTPSAETAPITPVPSALTMAPTVASTRDATQSSNLQQRQPSPQQRQQPQKRQHRRHPHHEEWSFSETPGSRPGRGRALFSDDGEGKGDEDEAGSSEDDSCFRAETGADRRSPGAWLKTREHHDPSQAGASRLRTSLGGPARLSNTAQAAAEDLRVGWDAIRAAQACSRSFQEPRQDRRGAAECAVDPSASPDAPAATSAFDAPAVPGTRGKVAWDNSRVGETPVSARAGSGPGEGSGAKQAGDAGTSGGAAADAGAVRSSSTTRKRVEVPLALRAVLLYASTERGMDLRKWFDIGCRGTEWTRSSSMSMVRFELVLAGLAEGLKAGLSQEEQDEIDAAVTPEVVAKAVSASAAPTSQAICDLEHARAAASGQKLGSSAGASDDSNDSPRIDVCKLLTLCGVPPMRKEEDDNGGNGPGQGSNEREGGNGGGSGCQKQGEVLRGSAGRCNRGDRPDAGVMPQATTEDENSLRRVTHQADLYGRLLTSLGLKQPVGCSDQSFHAAWETSLRTSTVTLKAFRKALREVGLPLSRARAAALGVRGCGPLIVGETASSTRASKRCVARRPKHGSIGGGTEATTTTAGDMCFALQAWKLRGYLLRLRIEPKSEEAREQRRKRLLAEHPAAHLSDELNDLRGNGDEGGRGCSTSVVPPADFATWGKRVRAERASRERQRKREFQKALAGHAHGLTPEELEDCVRRFEIMPQEVLDRELHAMGQSFAESMTGARRARGILREWTKASPVERNWSSPDDADQRMWEQAQVLSPAQRRCRARSIVAREREQELADSEQRSASVSRGLFLAYIRSVGSAGGESAGAGVSLLRWLEDRQAAIKKARELEAGRERAQALSKADTVGRQALVSEVKDELVRLVGCTKKPQRMVQATGMEVLRSSRDGLDLSRRLKRLEKAAAEERAKRAANARPKTSHARQETKGRPHHGDTPLFDGDQALLSREAFIAEMGNILFSLTADGATAARAKELAGVSLITPELRKRWAMESRASADEDGDLRKSGAEQQIPSAEELFTAEEGLLLGRGKREAERKRELAIQKYREWCRGKSKEARRIKRQQQQVREEKAEGERRRKQEGLRAYRRWVRLAARDLCYSTQNNKVVPRARLTSRRVKTAQSSQPLRNADKGNEDYDALYDSNRDRAERGQRAGNFSHTETARRRRGPWDSGTDGANLLYARGLGSSDLPEFL